MQDKVDGSKLSEIFWFTTIFPLFMREPRKVFKISVSPIQSRELRGENLTVSVLPMFSSKVTAVVGKERDAALAALHW
jgi:hypothetical protein